MKVPSIAKGRTLWLARSECPLPNELRLVTEEDLEDDAESKGRRVLVETIFDRTNDEIRYLTCDRLYVAESDEGEIVLVELREGIPITCVFQSLEECGRHLWRDRDPLRLEALNALGMLRFRPYQAP